MLLAFAVCRSTARVFLHCWWLAVTLTVVDLSAGAMQPHTTTLLASQAQSLCNFARIYVDVRLPMQRPALHDSQWLAGRDRLPKPRRRLGINLQRATPGTACLRHSGGVKPASASDVRSVENRSQGRSLETA